jgi:N-acetylneuraminic acid mutarotase
MGGCATVNVGYANQFQSGCSAVYGALKAEGASYPGGRDEETTWTDSTGNFWLFGGYGYDAIGNLGYLNDLWVFFPSENQWAWMGGSSTTGSNCPLVHENPICGRPGVYGTLGTPAAGNIPGARVNANTWTDSSGNLWLFGGYGINSTTVGAGILNDLWEFNPSTNQWAWTSGSSNGSLYGVYGRQGTAASTNIPGGRFSAVSWSDESGKLWLFGGIGFDSTGTAGYLNDLWEYQP